MKGSSHNMLRVLTWVDMIYCRSSRKSNYHTIMTLSNDSETDSGSVNIYSLKYIYD